MSRSSSWSQGRKASPGRKTYYKVLFIQRGNGNNTEYSGKATSSKKRKNKTKQKRAQRIVRQLRVAAGAHAYRETIERRASTLDKNKK